MWGPQTTEKWSHLFDILCPIDGGAKLGSKETWSWTHPLIAHNAVLKRSWSWVFIKNLLAPAFDAATVGSSADLCLFMSSSWMSTPHWPHWLPQLGLWLFDISFLLSLKHKIWHQKPCLASQFCHTLSSVNYLSSWDLFILQYRLFRRTKEITYEGSHKR